MADWSDFVSECRTITGASTAYKTFIYDRVSTVNTDKAKSYPAVLLESVPTFETKGINKSFLPTQTRYSTRLFFWDTYHQSDKATTNLEDAQSALKLLGDQWIAELTRRNLTADTTAQFQLTNITELSGLVVDKVHQNELLQISYDVEVLINESCSGGSFSY